MKNNEIELLTPFAKVKIVIDEKDLWAKDEIEKWIYGKCGLLTPNQVAETLQRFEYNKLQMRKKL